MAELDDKYVKKLEKHYAEFLVLLGGVRRLYNAGKFEEAAVYAQIAGNFAWLNHTGLFASLELEQILGKIGASLPAVKRTKAVSKQPQSVLHVVTQAYQTGGSTQAVVCWLKQDYGRQHRVCITRQGSSEVPEKLKEALASASHLIRLDDLRGGLLVRAMALRQAAAQADVVILHSHPYDVVPVIAFNGIPELPSVIYVNHADHVFWLGISVANVVSNMRKSGADLAIDRRGLQPARSAIMERPLRFSTRKFSRDQAKQQLGISPGKVLVVTAADGSKYRPVASAPGFLDIVSPVFANTNDALLLAAGPSPHGDWANAESQTNGRIKALGRLNDVGLLLEAADIYLDSFPFSSLTSLLEAGSLGVPAMTFRGHPEDCAVLGADTCVIDEHLLSLSEPEAFRQQLRQLITDKTLRIESGGKIQQAIVTTHTEEGWRSRMAQVYELAANSGSPIVVGESKAKFGAVDVLLQLTLEETGYSQGLEGAIKNHLALLPLRQRLVIWLKLLMAGNPASVKTLIPEWLIPKLANIRRLVRQ